VRGEHNPGTVYDYRSKGIIPACAGSTSACRAAWSSTRDHPRVRGEHMPYGWSPVPVPGSSPRARGAPQSVRGEAERAGIIPACAGSTRSNTRAQVTYRDHPRVRGEHQLGHVTDGAAGGIIPACAGSTTPASTRTLACGDHPRVRGEHVRRPSGLIPWMGSSPRARGALAPVPVPPATDGIIPACAGSTSPWCWFAVSHRDHPRVRGEHAQTWPLALVPVWIIPACAGSTRPRRACAARVGDHPRVRGEHVS